MCLTGIYFAPQGSEEGEASSPQEAAGASQAPFPACLDGPWGTARCSRADRHTPLRTWARQDPAFAPPPPTILGRCPARGAPTSLRNTRLLRRGSAKGARSAGASTLHGEGEAEAARTPAPPPRLRPPAWAASLPLPPPHSPGTDDTATRATQGGLARRLRLRLLPVGASLWPLPGRHRAKGGGGGGGPERAGGG